MTLKFLFRRKFHIMLILLAFFTTIMGFSIRKYNYRNVEKDTLADIRKNIANILNSRLSEDDKLTAFDPFENSGFEYQNLPDYDVEMIDYYRNLYFKIGDIMGAMSFVEIKEKKEIEHPLQVEPYLRYENELIEMYRKTQDKPYNILDENFLNFLMSRNEILKEKSFDLLDENHEYLGNFLIDKNPIHLGFISIIPLSILLLFVLRDEKIEFYLDTSYSFSRLKKIVIAIATVIFYCILVFLFLMLFSALNYKIGPLDYPFFVKIPGIHSEFKIVSPVFFYFTKCISFLILSLFFTAVSEFILRSSWPDILKYIVFLGFILISIFMPHSLKNISNLDPISFFRKSTYLELNSLDIVKMEILVFLTAVLFLTGSFGIKREITKKNFIYISKRPFTIRNYMGMNLYLIILSLILTNLFAIFLGTEIDRYYEEYKFKRDYYLVSLENMNRQFRVRLKDLKSELKNVDEDFKHREEFVKNRVKSNYNAMIKNANMNITLTDHQVKSILLRSKIEENPNAYYEELIDAHKFYGEYFKGVDEYFDERAYEVYETYYSSLLKNNIKGSVFTNTNYFTVAKGPASLHQNIFESYVKNGINHEKNATSYIYNFFHMKISLILIVLNGIILNMFRKYRSHIDFKLNLPKSRDKIFNETFLSGLNFSLIFFFSSIFLIGLIGFLEGGIGDLKFPVIILDENLTEISIFRFIILSSLMSILAIININLISAVISIVFSKNMSIFVSLIFLIGLPILSFVINLPFLPTSYYDAGSIVNEFTNEIIKSSYDFSLGIVILILSSIIFYVAGKIVFKKSMKF